MSNKSKTVANPAIVLNNVTLTSSHNSTNCGILEIGERSEQVILYGHWTGGTAADPTRVSKLYIKVWTSPDNKKYYPVMHEIIDDNSKAWMKHKEWAWEYATNIQVIGEQIEEYVHSGVNNAGGRMTLQFIPITGSSLSIYHNGTAFSTVTERATDSNFTTPASLAAGTIEWSLATGNLNFASADVTSYNGYVITADYNINTNLVMIPIATRDRWIKVSARELYGAGGTLSVYASITRG